jgi:quercetin dioxygenase-like cupin family protein
MENEMAFLKLKDVEQIEKVPGCHVRFVHSDNMSFAYWNLDLNAVIPTHSHPHEQVGSIISGLIEVTAGSEKKVLGPGEVVAIPSNVEHSVITLEPAYVIDVFYPIREDYR